MEDNVMLTFFMLMNATKEWLALTPVERERFVAAEVGPIFATNPSVRMTFYDAEAFSARCSDVAVFETASIDDYTGVIDALRNTKLYTVPYFEIIDIIPAKQAEFV
jgi:darcynin-like uncharacterized protein